MGIDLQREGAVATVTINQPERLNALNAELLGELLAIVRTVREDASIRAVILTGAGERAFVAGADIKAMSTMTSDEALAFARLAHAVMNAIDALPIPVIAAVNGFALGGGTELALAADIRIASENAVFAQPEVSLGIIPGWGGTQRLTRLVGEGIAAELIFTGRRVAADEALRIGLVSAVVSQEDLLSHATSMADTIAANAGGAVRTAKRLIRRSRESGAQAALAEEARAFADLFGTHDQREGMTAFVEKRAAEFDHQ